MDDTTGQGLCPTCSHVWGFTGRSGEAVNATCPNGCGPLEPTDEPAVTTCTRSQLGLAEFAA